MAAYQEITREWWTHRRSAFNIAVSALVIDEVSCGDPGASQLRLTSLADIESVMITPEAVTLAEALVARGALPAKARAHAVHVALAAIWKADYLLTRNRTHIASGETLPRATL